LHCKYFCPGNEQPLLHRTMNVMTNRSDMSGVRDSIPARKCKGPTSVLSQEVPTLKCLNTPSCIMD
jgi:hypothetical protein